MLRDSRSLGPAGLLGRLVQAERKWLSHWRFWAVQALVVILAGVHFAVERMALFPAGSALYFLPEASLLLPVGYAALNFGLRGSVLTALWCTLLSLPNQFLWHGVREFPGTLLQLGIVNAVAIFVGQRVENEVAERRRAQASHLMLQSSESRYRTLFESSAEAILVCDREGLIRQANQAAAQLLAAPVESLPGEVLSDLIGKGGVGASNGGAAGDGDGELVLTDCHGRKVYVEPVRMILPGDGGETLIQVVLRDVTRQRNRGDEWRTYARSMLLGQDHERRRMAGELHHNMMRSLTCILSELDGAGQMAGEWPDLGRKLSAVRTEVEDLAAAMRHFTSELEPPDLGDTGLVATLRELLAETTIRSEISGTLKVEGGQRRLTPGIEQGLYHIAAAAMENVERHAGATDVVIRLAFESDCVHLEVCDNGRGFTFAATRRELVEHGSLGLIGMEVRAALLGGELHVDSLPGRGTTVLVDTPI